MNNPNNPDDRSYPNPWAQSDNVIDLKHAQNQRSNGHNAPRRLSAPPMINLPPATKYLMGVMIFIHVLVWVLPRFLSFLPDEMWWVYSFGFIPARFTDSSIFNFIAPLTPITFSFLHAGWLHIAMNMLMLAAFAAGIERNYSGKTMLFIFIGSGIVAAFAHFLFDMHGTNPVIGASGGISGLFGATLIMLKAQQRLNTQNNSLMPIIGIWVVITILFGLMGGPNGSVIAWVAHIGGFLGGLGLMKILIQKSGNR